MTDTRLTHIRYIGPPAYEASMRLLHVSSVAYCGLADPPSSFSDTHMRLVLAGTIPRATTITVCEACLRRLTGSER